MTLVEHVTYPPRRHPRMVTRYSDLHKRRRRSRRTTWNDIIWMMGFGGAGFVLCLWVLVQSTARV